VLDLFMALRSRRIDYTIYAPQYEPGKGCWDYQTATKARLAAKRQGVGAIVRRNVNLIGKDHKEKDWWVERVWEWDGNNFVDIMRHPTKRFSLSSPATE
jgi:hypothetical protein